MKLAPRSFAHRASRSTSFRATIGASLYAVTLASGAGAQEAKLAVNSSWQPGTFCQLAVSTPLPVPQATGCVLFVSTSPPPAGLAYQGVPIGFNPSSAIQISLPSQPHLWAPTAPTEERWHLELKLSLTVPSGIPLYMQAALLPPSGPVLLTAGATATTMASAPGEVVFSVSHATDWGGFGAPASVHFNVIDVDTQKVIADVITTPAPNNTGLVVGSPSKSSDGRHAAIGLHNQVGGSLNGGSTLVLDSDGSYRWIAQPPTNKVWIRVGSPRFRPNDNSHVWVLEMFANPQGGCPGGNGTDSDHDLVAYDVASGLQVQRLPVEYSGPWFQGISGTTFHWENWTFDATGAFVCFNSRESYVCSPSWGGLKYFPMTGSLSIGPETNLQLYAGLSDTATHPMRPVPGTTMIILVANTQTFVVDLATGAVSQPVVGSGTKSQVGAVSQNGQFFVHLNRDAADGGNVYAYGIPTTLVNGAVLPSLGTYAVTNYGLISDNNKWLKFFDEASFIPTLGGSIVFGPRSSWGGWMYRLSPAPAGGLDYREFDPYVNASGTFYFDHMQSATSSGFGTACAVGLATRDMILASAVDPDDKQAMLLDVKTMTSCDMTPLSIDTPPTGTAAIDTLKHGYIAIAMRL